MKKREFIIIHGLNGSPEGHWQNYLYKELKKRGEKAFFPQFPENNQPNLEKWIAYLNKFKKHIHENSTIIAHSMGVILWLHYLKKQLNIKVKNIILVAPPSNDFLRGNIYTNSFSNFPLDYKEFENSREKSVLIASANDIYCKETAKSIFAANLPLEYVELPKEAGHINIESGYGSWKYILELALRS